jgi:chitinase
MTAEVLMNKLGFRIGILLGFSFMPATPCWSKPSHLVVGYSASWFDSLYPPESYHYDALTHINRSFLIPQPDGSVTTESNYWNLELEKSAHAHGVKLLASIGGAADNANNWLSIANNPDTKTLFLDNLEKLIVSHNYDGVDIDWEPSPFSGGEDAAYISFMESLRKRFPKWIITTALPIRSDNLSWSEVIKQVDFINIMAYDFSGPWVHRAAFNASLYHSQNSHWDNGFNDDEALNQLENKYQVPPEKIVLGVPFYGVQFFVDHMGNSFSNYPDGQESQLQFYEIYPMVVGKNYSVLWDEGAKVPYLEKLKGRHVITYDDSKSIGLKCQYALDKKLGGIMIWNLGADIVGKNTPLLDTVAKAMGVQPIAMPAGGLLKTIQGFSDAVRESYGKLSTAYNRLLAAKSSSAQAASPGPAPDLSAAPAALGEAALGQKVWQLQYYLSVYKGKLRDCQPALNGLSSAK